MISPQETRELTIRDPRPADESNWRRLWSGYCAFYETVVPEDVTAATWERMLAAGSPLFGRIADWDGQVAGFAISVLHEGSWTTRHCCYLEDLFVAPDFRGRGIGRALIEDLLQLCRQQGWSRLYWHTRGSNREARRLYDRYAVADDFVRYRMFLDPAPWPASYSFQVCDLVRLIEEVAHQHERQAQYDRCRQRVTRETIHCPRGSKIVFKGRPFIRPGSSPN